jgi:acyl dehydratase
VGLCKRSRDPPLQFGSMPYYSHYTSSATFTLDQEDFKRFAALSGDDNPIHVDPLFAARTKFGKPVAHGMHLYSLVCRVLGSALPGPGTMILSQEMMFPAPTFAGEEITVAVRTLQTRSIPPWYSGYPAGQSGNIPGRYIQLETTITKEDGTICLRGMTWALTPGPGIAILADFLRGPDVVPHEIDLSGTNTHRNFSLGQSACVRRVYTEEDLIEYGKLTGDLNPLYAPGGYAKMLGFSGPIVPPGLTGGLFSNLLGTKLPGSGTNWLKQTLVFANPAYIGEELTATVEVRLLRPEKDLVNLSTSCRKPDGVVVCIGEALVLVSDLD